MLKKLVVFVVLCGLSVCAFAQSPGTLKGQVADETGAVIPGAKVTAAGPGGVVKSATTVADGTYSLTGLAPGDWTVQASSPGLTQQQVAKVNVSSATQTLNLTLRVALEKQEVTVQEAGNNTVTLDPSNNAGALVLKGEDLDALSDDPDDLAQDLQALAGPAAGPNGGQIYIDGFTGGRLPPKEAIREIRINSNPFSSEYDRLGFGRIEIFTKPGTDKFRGMAQFNISDGQFNSRNPFLNASPGQPFAMPDFQTRQFEGNLSGPLSKKASFFIDAEHRSINDAAVIYTPYFVDPTSFAAEPFSTAAPTPQSRTSFSPRVDYALSPNNTLMARYTYTHNDQTDRGIGGFNLPSRGYGVLTTQQTGQLTETAIINSKWINETRLQIMNDNVTQNGNLLPVIDVASAFTEGGSGVGQSYNSQRHYEIQNYTSTTRGTHSIKFGVRVRASDYNDFSQSNFGGTFQFNAPPASLGFTGINSVQAYQITLQGIQQGLSMAQIRAMGGGPAQFTINSGNPALGVSQVDFGAFYQDDWRLKPNFTLSLGLRYETQNNIHDHTDFAPRVGFAWAPGSKTAGSVFSRPKLVVRGGVGVFYDRVSDNLTLQQLRYQGGYQQSITVEYPDFFPNIPAISQLPTANQTHIKYQIDPNLHAPYVVQSAIGVERQLPKNTSLAVTYTNTRGIHELRLRDINAPLPGTYILGQPQTGVRPYGAIGDVFNYESTGILNQNQLITNVNSRINSKISLTGGYFLSRAMSNFNGGLSPFDYNLSKEYGRAPYDVRHRGMIMGSIATKWDIRLNPFVILNSGAPFNIVTSTVAGNTSRTLRPAFAPSGAVGPNIVATRFGTFDTNPYNADGSVKNGETIIPWDYGTSPSSVTVNMRLSKTWGFGPERGANAAAASRGGGGDRGPGGGGDHGGGGGRGGPGGGGPGGMGGMRMGGGGGGGGSTNRRYNLTLSVNARNLLNHTNYGPINSALGSPTFGTSTTLAGGFGAEQSPLNNRRLEFSMRFSF